MRPSLVIACLSAVAVTGALVYFGSSPFTRGARSALASALHAPPGPSARPGNSLAPADLSELAVWLRGISLDQRAQFIRDRIASLSPTNSADRARIRAFLLGGADVEIERPLSRSLPFDTGKTTLRRYLLGLLEKFPAAEAVPIARTILAATRDFREADLCLRVIERDQPGANRADALAALQRLLPLAAQPAKPGADTERYLAEYDRFAEPMAQYQLAELHPAAMQVVAANPMLAGRYTQAVEAFDPGTRATALRDLFANPAVARELVNDTGTRSADLWLDPGYRELTAQFFANQMTDAQRLNFIASMAEDTGLHYSPHPLAEPDKPVLQPVDPAAETARAKARLAMLDAVAPRATTPQLQSAMDSSRSAIAAEVDAAASAPPKRLQPIPLLNLDPLGDPASAHEDAAETGAAAPPPAASK